MNKNQNRAFWSMYFGFLITGTICIYFQGAFNNISNIGIAILFVAHLIVAYAIRKYVEKNPEKIDKWFQ